MLMRFDPLCAGGAFRVDLDLPGVQPEAIDTASPA